MALNKVSQAVLQQVYSRISDPDTGFNPGLVTNAVVYGLSPTFINIDWSSTSTNFYFGQIDPELLEKSGLVKYPFACMYIKESQQTGTQKFNQFSGAVRCILEMHMSWGQVKGIQNFEAYPSCVEDVVFDVMNRVANQNWAYPAVYNGQIQCKRGPLLFGGNNFKQAIGFSMLFEVHQ